MDEDAYKYCKQKGHGWGRGEDDANETMSGQGNPLLASDAVPRGRPPPRNYPEFLTAWLRWPDWHL